LARALRHTAVYLLWKKACIGRDRGECTECGNTRALTVHHCRISMYEMCVKHGFKKELVEADTTFVDISNGITQCRSCHAKQHRKGIMNG
jgi:5-methylcytosine-specific restriction endonuclease McrA